MNYFHLCVIVIVIFSSSQIQFQVNSDKDRKSNIQKQMNDDRVPPFFDARVNFSGCIHLTGNYSSCGSDYAIAAASVLSDRLCIKSQQSTNILLSAQDIINCDGSEPNCLGSANSVFTYLMNKGTCSDQCVPYSNVQPGKCKSGICQNPVDQYISYKCKSGSVNTLSSIIDIQKEIMNNGPVYSDFTIYADFADYHSGIYYQSSHIAIKTKSVKILGWGNENGILYWLCANNLGPRWGEDGYFRIAFYEAGIASIVYFCDPEINS